jgi:thymidylate kinase
MDYRKERNQHKFEYKSLDDKIKTPKSWETAIHKTSEQQITTVAAKQMEKKNTKKIKKKKKKNKML